MERMVAFIENLKKSEIITDFDEAIFNFNLEKAIVHKDKSITFNFYSEFETAIKAEEWFLDLFYFWIFLKICNLSFLQIA